MTASRAHHQPAALTVAAVSPEEKSHFCQSSASARGQRRLLAYIAVSKYGDGLPLYR
ncbi:protein of unknown function (plasmid) [Shinella sp. WSC3-e]|nr:hypothetical protein SHINE37_60082 [Rhizobiaceae bacterium]CAK7262151.1 protein of unknown function [Shinella sp. WSC3-e]